MADGFFAALEATLLTSFGQSLFFAFGVAALGGMGNKLLRFGPAVLNDAMRFGAGLLEHPQTIALIISHLSHHKASQILVGLPSERQIEVVRRVANMEPTSPEVIREVEAGLEARLSNVLVHAVEKVGGVATVAEILNLCDRSTEKSIIDGVESEDPDLVEEIRRLMFIFEDILKVDDKGIQAILKEVDNEELCLALKTGSDELKEKIYSNMSARAAELIKEDMQYMGPVRLSDVEAAQQRIVDIARRLEDAGEIIIAGRGDKDVIV